MATTDPIRARLANARAISDNAWRLATARMRRLPDFLLIGTQRGGTTSLYSWLCSHPGVSSSRRREIHYFANAYDRGARWYQSQFPLRRPGRVTGENTPYLLFHPLAPQRVHQDLPETTRFLVLLRDPVQRAVSHYWLERRIGNETEPLDAAIELEAERLAGETARVERGEFSFTHRHFSYQARGDYAEQLERWFAQVGRERILVVESERLFADEATTAEILRWLGLPPRSVPFPALNEARRAEPESDAVLRRLQARFEGPNERLFDLLGRRLWAQ